MITSVEGRVARVVRFDPTLRFGASAADIRIDWGGWLTLTGPEPLDEVELEMHVLSWWQTPILVRSHPDAAVRIALALGFIGLGLGIVSVLLALIGFWRPAS